MSIGAPQKNAIRTVLKTVKAAMGLPLHYIILFEKLFFRIETVIFDTAINRHGHLGLPFF